MANSDQKTEETGQSTLYGGAGETPIDVGAEKCEEKSKEEAEYPFGKGIYTKDKELVNEYLQLARRILSFDVSKRSVLEQFNILFAKINKLVPLLKKLSDGNWRDCNNQLVKGSYKVLGDQSLSGTEKKKITDNYLFMTDLLGGLLENRKCLFVIYNNYLHHQKQLSHILHKKPTETEDLEQGEIFI